MICTNAARSSLRILDVQFLRASEEGKQGVSNQIGLLARTIDLLPSLQLGMIGTLMIASMILLLNILDAKRSGSTNIDGDLELVNKAVYMLMSLGVS